MLKVTVAVRAAVGRPHLRSAHSPMPARTARRSPRFGAEFYNHSPARTGPIGVSFRPTELLHRTMCDSLLWSQNGNYRFAPSEKGPHCPPLAGKLSSDFGGRSVSVGATGFEPVTSTV